MGGERDARGVVEPRDGIEELRAELISAGGSARAESAAIAQLRSELTDECSTVAEVREENAGLERDVVDLARMLTELKSAVHTFAVAGPGTGQVPAFMSPSAQEEH